MPKALHRRLKVVLVVLACTVAAVLLVGIWAAWSEEAQRPRHMARLICALVLEQLGDLLTVYADEHDGRFPSEIPQAFSEEDAEKDALLLRCPGEKAWSHLGSEGLGEPYAYVGGGMRMKAVLVPAATPLAFDSKAVHPGRTRNVLMVSGEVKHFGERDFQALVQAALAREQYGEEAKRRMSELLKGDARRR